MTRKASLMPSSRNYLGPYPYPALLEIARGWWLQVILPRCRRGERGWARRITFLGSYRESAFSTRINEILLFCSQGVPSTWLVLIFRVHLNANVYCCGFSREEEDADDFAFPLTLKSPKKTTPLDSPLQGHINGVSQASSASEKREKEFDNSNSTSVWRDPKLAMQCLSRRQTIVRMGERDILLHYTGVQQEWKRARS